MNGKKRIGFILVFSLFATYFLFCLPTYISSKYLSSPYASFFIFMGKAISVFIQDR